MTRGLKIGWRISQWLLLFTILAADNVRADNTNISYAPPPGWVRSLEWVTQTNRPAGSTSAGTHYLLYEEQTRPKSNEQFVRIVESMDNESGVQASGSLRLGFDAEFQQLCLHRVVIHRGGKTINCLNPAAVRIIQPEPDLDGDMFTGRQTAVLFIEDLRVGDILEYAYTIRGANPVLKGHFSDCFTIQDGSPVDHQLYRIVWDSPVPLQHRSYLSAVPPAIKSAGDGTEYSWEFTALPAIPDEDYKPADYEVYPYVEVSDFSDWRSVVDWALPLYDCNPTNIPPEMRDLLDQWQSSAATDAERALLALQFVQDDLRYTGIELGPDSYRPADPVETFQKRFGDCKGKVVLLRFLLQQMHIQSSPALVNSSTHGAIASRLPTPFAFDHVILSINLDGKNVWLDPTCSHQGGSLLTRYVPPYGKALLIRPGNGVLTDVPRCAAENGFWQNVTSTFTLKSRDQPAAFTVHTEYRGASADDMRDEIAGGNPETMAKNYLNYYSKLYPGITGGHPLEFNDNRAADILTVDESYSITNLWTQDDAQQPWQACFYADNLNDALTDPETRLRKTPLALTYPRLRQQQVIVHLPDKDWQIPDLDTNVEHDAFSFKYHRRLRDLTVTFSYECRTKLATVPLALVPSYLVKRDSVAGLLSDTLQNPDDKDDKSDNGINWVMVIIAAFGMGAAITASIWYWRRMNSGPGVVPPLLVANPQWQGLGGWLILVGFGLCLAPVVRIFSISQHWEAYFSIRVWQNVAMPSGAGYHPLYAPLLIYELLCNIFIFQLNLLTLWLFFGKRRALPKFFIALALSNVLFLGVDHIAAGMIPSASSMDSHVEGQNDVIRAVFYAVIWIPYMLKSRRVKATFIK